MLLRFLCGLLLNQLRVRQMKRVIASWILLIACLARAASDPVPSWLAKAPRLPAPQGEVIRVATADELLAAVDRVGEGGTISLSDGEYKVPRVIVLNEKKKVTMRSASGDPTKVILRGHGWDSGDDKGDDILHIAHCDGVTIADLTFTDCRSYGVKVEAENAPRDIQIYNCRFRDIGVRALKGSAGKDPNVRAVKGSVRYCQFENTKVPEANWLYGGDYIAAIDMMALEDWTFSDNFFRNVKGRNGGGRAAIFIWVRSREVTVERNAIVNCDRGIAFGNPGQSTANLGGERFVYVADGMIRNNFIAGGPDCGIELWYGDRIKVYHNSIWRPEQNWARGIRVGTGTANSDIVNNLVHGDIRLEGGDAQLRNNLAGRLEGYFVDPPSGNLALTAAAGGAIQKGVSLPEVTEDIRGRRRSQHPDLGAWELDRQADSTSTPTSTAATSGAQIAQLKEKLWEAIRAKDAQKFVDCFLIEERFKTPTVRETNLGQIQYLLGRETIDIVTEEIRPRDLEEIMAIQNAEPATRPRYSLLPRKILLVVQKAENGTTGRRFLIGEQNGRWYIVTMAGHTT
jgi:hypothetical protein